MRRRPRPLLVAGFVAVMIALWIAHDPPDPTRSRALRDAAERLRAYYREHPLPEGWAEAAVAVHGAEVWADLTLPGADAAHAPDALAEALGARCPPKADLVWRLLRPGQEIQVRGLAPGGQVLAAVDCRHAGP